MTQTMTVLDFCRVCQFAIAFDVRMKKEEIEVLDPARTELLAIVRPATNEEKAAWQKRNQAAGGDPEL